MRWEGGWECLESRCPSPFHPSLPIQSPTNGGGGEGLRDEDGLMEGEKNGKIPENSTGNEFFKASFVSNEPYSWVHL